MIIRCDMCCRRSAPQWTLKWFACLLTRMAIEMVCFYVWYYDVSARRRHYLTHSLHACTRIWMLPSNCQFVGTDRTFARCEDVYLHLKGYTEAGVVGCVDMCICVEIRSVDISFFCYLLKPLQKVGWPWPRAVVPLLCLMSNAVMLSNWNQYL